MQSNLLRTVRVVRPSTPRGRVLLVDDDLDLASDLATWLELEGFACDVAANAQEALGMAAVREFDVVVTDLAMPGLHGLELLRRLRADRPDLEVIILTGAVCIETVVQALRGRAFDFLRKPLLDLHILTDAVARAAASPGKRQISSPPAASPALSTREREILVMVAKGCNNKQIAGHLAISEKTIRNTLSHVYEKLHATNRTHAVHLCRAQGLI